MLFTKIIFLLIFSTQIFATNYLQSNYFVKNDFVMLSDIVQVNKKNDKKLFNIEQYRHSKRIKREKLLKILQKNGYNDYASQHPYIQFTKQSPIDTIHIQNSIKKLYIQKYKTIKILSITLAPMYYLEKLPKNYTVHFNERAYLANKGVLYIKTDDNKEIFFHYKILAKVSVLTVRKKIKKDNELTSINTRKKSIILNRFRSMPLQDLHTSRYQAKHNLRTNDIITIRDVIGLYLVKRGSNVNVSLQNAGIDIFFSAKALQNGRLGDTISVVGKNDKKLKVVVVGRNRTEVK